MPPCRRPREPSPSSDSAEEGRDQMLDPHILMQFPRGSEAHTRLKRLVGREIVEPRTNDWSILETLGATERATAIVGASGPCRRMLEMGVFPAYREIVLEFLSTFEFHPLQAGGLDCFVHFMWTQVDEDGAVLTEWWPVIGDAPFVNMVRVSRIRDPLHRYLHRCIACTITGRRLS
ncbi:hypothetical protein R6Q57_005774 [Mikania cordata]